MIKVKRIGHATFETPDLDRNIDYYRSAVGLVPVARKPNRAFLAFPLGQLAIVLEKGAATQRGLGNCNMRDSPGYREQGFAHPAT